jgi:hypothetical protein
MVSPLACLGLELPSSANADLCISFNSWFGSAPDTLLGKMGYRRELPKGDDDHDIKLAVSGVHVNVNGRGRDALV